MIAAPLTPERAFRGPGCTEECRVIKAIIPGRFGRSDVLLHDPVVHEAFGRIATGVDGSAIVWTGSLVIDRWAKTATSAGRLVPLTPRYWGILDYLAGQLGRRCSHAEILADVWGPGSRDDAHLLRVNIARLRERLGDNARLIETAPGLGYRLLHVEPIESPSR